MTKKGEKKTKPKIETEKIVVNTEDELIDLIKKIEETKAGKVILTFADPSDILISPINLKVLQETADDTEVLLVAQIVQNPVGIRNARSAGMAATDATGSILQAFWDEAEHNMRGRTDRKKSLLKKAPTPVAVEEEKIEQPLEPESSISDEQRSKFQKRISEAIEKSKTDLSGSKKRVVEHGGVLIGLDQDVSEAGEEPQKPSLIGKDIGFMASVPDLGDGETTKEPSTDIPGRVTKVFAGIWLFILAIPAKVGAFFAKKGSKVILIRIIAPLLIVLLLGLWLAYTMLPLVRVRMYIESKSVSVEKVFAGDTSTTSFDFENGTVPVKKETVEKSGSDNTNATGTAYKGERAVGNVDLTFWDYVNEARTETIPSGTVLTTTSAPAGLKFETTVDAQIGDGGDITETVPVQAQSVGEEYNLAAGQTFSVAGFDSSDMSGGNSAAFSGGSKEAYTVFSKSDRDKVVNSLKKDAFAAAKEDLGAEAVDGWELIESTIKNSLDGDPESDTPVGAEADIVNVSIKTKSTALFYQKGAIEDEIEGVLTQAARDQNLFESSTEAQLELDQNVTQEITVEEVKGEDVKIKLVASGRIKPQIKKDEIVNKLKGRGWEEGLAILNDLSFATKPTEVQFLPEYFPESLRSFPSRQGRILVTIVEEDTSQE